MNNISRRNFLHSLAASAVVALIHPRQSVPQVSASESPNVLWILVDDINPNLSCYGETLIATPTLDGLAAYGVRFTRAYVSGPICSPSRTAMLTGLYQTTVGGHHHRCGRGNDVGHVALKLPDSIKTIPELFKESGYYTSHMDKTDYNFVRKGMFTKGYQPPRLPRKPDYRQLWAGRVSNQPFFAQMNLQGPKNKKVKGPNPVDPNSIVLPPNYANNIALRRNWADYLNSIERTDYEIKDCLEALRAEGLYDNTIILFAGDNGKAHLRGKQFLNEEGTLTPFIIRGPGVPVGQVWPDLVSLVDAGPTCLALAGIPVPDYIQGQALFGESYVEREYVVTARDRADETIDRIRAIEGPRYKYIRNYYPHKSHMQPNQYKDKLPITVRTRTLLSKGQLNADQRRIFDPIRPVEELYDLQVDPFELNNLALSASPPEILLLYRSMLDIWIAQTGDLGAFPEPVFFRLAAEMNNTPMNILSTDAAKSIHADIEALWKVGQNGVGNLPTLLSALSDAHYGLRYTGAYWIGVLGSQGQLSGWQLETARSVLLPMLTDALDLVRMAAARAVALLGFPEEAKNILRALLSNQNETIRLYTLMALEDMVDTGLFQSVLQLRPEIKICKSDPYQYAKNVAIRLDKNLG